jgi:hypothetical protein
MDLEYLRTLQPLTAAERRAAVVSRFQEARTMLEVSCASTLRLHLAVGALVVQEKCLLFAACMLTPFVVVA